MKKVLFLQNKGKSYAGVWNVNKLVGEELIKRGYEVHIISIRDNQSDITLEHDPRLVVDTINKNDLWESYHLVDIISELKKFNIFGAIKKLVSKFRYNISIKKDIKKLHNYIYNYNPDYIVTSHYQLLDMIPYEYLSRTIHEQHSSIKDAISNNANKKTFDKYKNNIKFLWLSKNSMDEAKKMGYSNSTYIYNAVRFASLERSMVTKNNKLIAITRLSPEKRIDLMIEIAEDIFKDSKYSDWKLEIYGSGEILSELNSLITNSKQIVFKGLTNNPMKELLSASINLNTSLYEGFSLTILEANECGVPTVAFDFGESSSEEIIDNKTGIIARDKEDYKNRLKELMDNPVKLDEFSVNAKKFSSNFQIENIIDKWISLFNSLK